MKKILFTLALLVSFVSFGQKFNGYTHIVVEDIEYKDGSMDKYDLIPKIIKFFKKKGLNTARLDEGYDLYEGEVNSDYPCANLILAISHTVPTPGSATETTFKFFDCNSDEVMKFYISAGCGVEFICDDPSKLSLTAKYDVNKGVEKILKIIKSRIGKYKFNPRKTPKAIELSPNDVAAYNNRGNSKADLEDYYGAIADFTKAIELNPNDAAAYYNRGNAKDDLEDYYGAISDYSKAIELNPNDAAAYYNRGNAKDDLEDYYGAISDYTKAIEIDPKDVDAYYNRGYSKNSLKDYYGAIADYTKSMELDPNNSDIIYFYRGVSKNSLKDYYGAISDYTKAIELDPNNATAYNNRAASKYFANDLKGACEDAKKSASLGYDASKLIQDVCN